MASRKIKNTKHIRRKMKTWTKVTIALAVLAIVIISSALFMSKGKTGEFNLQGVKELITSESTTVEFDKSSAGAGGVGQAGSMVIVNPEVSEGGRITGTGTLELTASNVSYVLAKYRKISAVANDGYKISGWKINDGNSTTEIYGADPASPALRIYYYADPSSINVPAKIDQDNVYVTNKNITVSAIFEKKATFNRDTLTVITSPNIGYISITTKHEDDENTKDYYGGYFTIKLPAQSDVKMELKLDSDDKEMFVDRDHPAVDYYLFDSNGKMLGKTALRVGTEYAFNFTGTSIVVVNPYLKTGYTGQAVGVAVPEEGGTATWTGNQMKATANEGYKFDHWEWVENGSENTSKDNPLFAKPLGTVVYKAIFVKALYKVDIAGIIPVDSCGVDGIGMYGQHSDATITVSPFAGYKFKSASWTTENGIAHRAMNPTIDADGKASFVVPDITEDIFITIEMESIKYNISVKESPSGYGTVKVENTITGDTGTDVEFAAGEKAVLSATANTGKVFLYWEDSKGNRYDTANLPIESVNSSENFTAYFSDEALGLEVTLDPGSDAGSIEVTYTSNDTDTVVTVTDLVISNIKANTDVTIKAVEKAGYHFLQFVEAETGKTYSENPLVFANYSTKKRLIAVYAPDEMTISAVAVPELGGVVTVSGEANKKKVKYGETVTLVATANTGYSFEYFEDPDGNKYVGSKQADGTYVLEFKAVNGSETYKAYFSKDNINITIDLTPAGAGTVRFNDKPAVSTKTTYNADGRSNIKLTATPKDGNEFLYWKDQDGNMYKDNPLNIVDISKDLTFIAVFESKITGIRVIASPASGGKVKQIVNDDGSITIVATANKGYSFINWKLDKTVLTKNKKYTIAAADVRDGDTYIAYFKKNSDYDAKSDITKEKFYREWRTVVTPYYTVTRDSMKLLALQTVAGLRQYDDATPGLKKYAAYANAEAYFDDRVAKDIARLDEKFGESELMTAEGEFLTPDPLPDHVLYEQMANEFTNKKFGDRYETEILTVKKIIEPENFDNKDRTYLWRYTGAEYKDNIYLLYNVNGKKHSWDTPIVDEDGVLKFTIDTLKNDDIVAVVRVKIK